jgi:hypothetical protein
MRGNCSPIGNVKTPLRGNCALLNAQRRATADDEPKKDE